MLVGAERGVRQARYTVSRRKAGEARGASVFGLGGAVARSLQWVTQTFRPRPGALSGM
jgi:hypothetical protein